MFVTGTRTKKGKSVMKRPRVAAFPKCYLDQMARGEMDVLEWIEMSKDLGAEGLEMYLPWLPRDPGALRRVRGAIEATGQSCPLLCFSPDFTHSDPAYRRTQIEEQKRAIDVSVELGVSCCRTLSGQRRPEVSRADGVRWVVECIREALEYAAARKVVLAMENHYKDGSWEYPEFAQKSDIFLEIIGKIDSPWFGVQYDPSNAVVAGEDPARVLNQVRHRVVSMHASDRYLEPGTSLEDMIQADGTLGYPKNICHGVTGQGMNDYDAIFTILKAISYDGWISIEDGMSGMDEMKASVLFLKEKIAQYFP